MQQATLVLRDIHQPPAPPWWPPAPGWWLVVGILLVALVLLAWFAARRRKRRALIAAAFDDALRSVATPAEEVAVMSELLRRAARRSDPRADRLQGDAWLAFLDVSPASARRRKAAARAGHGGGRAFSDGPGRLLLEGPYRRDVDQQQVAELRPLARARFLDWMAAR